MSKRRGQNIKVRALRRQVGEALRAEEGERSAVIHSGGRHNATLNGFGIWGRHFALTGNRRMAWWKLDHAGYSFMLLFYLCKMLVLISTFFLWGDNHS